MVVINSDHQYNIITNIQRNTLKKLQQSFVLAFYSVCITTHIINAIRAVTIVVVILMNKFFGHDLCKLSHDKPSKIN